MGESPFWYPGYAETDGIEISVIIPVHGEKHERNLAGCLFCLNHQSFRNFETIVVTDKIRHLHNKTSFYQAIDPQNREMNKNWMFNVGANNSKGKKLIFLDADMVFHEDYLQKIYESNLKWAIGWRSLYYLDETYSECFRQFNMIGFKSDLVSNCGGCDPNICAACGGSQVFDREFFFKEFHGHNENYFGWGGEDNDSTLRASTLIGSFNSIDCSIGHLNHEKIGSHSKNNSDQWWTTEHNTNEITRRIGKNRELGLVGNFDGPHMVKVEDLS